jgi:hypothetical protein
MVLTISTDDTTINPHTAIVNIISTEVNVEIRV